MNQSCLNEIDFPLVPLCYTCKTKITFHPFRHLILENQNKTTQTVFFHYFSPCWDLSYINEKFPNEKIIQAGFTFDSEKNLDSKTIRNFKQNIDLWII